MKWLLILFIGIIVIPTFAQNTTINLVTKSDIDHISSSIGELKNLLVQNQNEIDSLKNEINNTKSSIKTSDGQITTKLNETESQDKSTYQLLKSYTDTSLTFENIKEKISDLQFLNSSLISILTTLIGIVAGAHITKRYEKRKLKNELIDARRQMQKEFSRLHQQVWRDILDTRDVIRDQHADMCIINRLINRKTSVDNEFLQHIHGLHFIFWDFTLPHMSQFTESEKEQFMLIHNFITDANEILIGHHNRLKGKLQNILSTQKSNGAKTTRMNDELIIDFNARMRIYCSIYRRIKNLNIGWLNWRTLEIKQQTPYSEMCNTFPNFVQKFLRWLSPERFSNHRQSSFHT